MEIEDVTEETSNGTTRTVTRKASAKEGAGYAESLAIPLRGDLFWLPGSGDDRIAFTGFLRTAWAAARNNRLTNVGAGIFVLKKDSPMTSLGGTVLEVRDLFDAQGRGLPTGRRLAVSVQVNVPINF